MTVETQDPRGMMVNRFITSFYDFVYGGELGQLNFLGRRRYMLMIGKGLHAALMAETEGQDPPIPKEWRTRFRSYLESGGSFMGFPMGSGYEQAELTNTACLLRGTEYPVAVSTCRLTTIEAPSRATCPVTGRQFTLPIAIKQGSVSVETSLGRFHDDYGTVCRFNEHWTDEAFGKVDYHAGRVTLQGKIRPSLDGLSSGYSDSSSASGGGGGVNGGSSDGTGGTSYENSPFYRDPRACINTCRDKCTEPCPSTCKGICPNDCPEFLQGTGWCTGRRMEINLTTFRAPVTLVWRSDFTKR